MTTDAGAVPDLLNWYEGMLLLPEHFQKAARRQETLLPYLTSAASPYAWGVKTLQTAPLDNGVFEVTKVEAIMPDGLLVVFPDPAGADPPLQLNLNDIKPAPALQTIYLVVPRWTDDALGIGGQARYRKSKGAVITQGDPLYPPVDAADAEQPWLRPTLDLRSDAQGPPPDKFVRLAVARVRLQEMRFVLERLQPPRFQVAKDEPVYDVTRKVADRLREEAKKLDERLQTDNSANGAAAPPQVPFRILPSNGSLNDSLEDRLRQAMRLLDEKAQSLQAKAVSLERQAESRADLRALARTLPRLEALLATRPHPFHLYLALCDVIGDIAVLVGELALPDAIPVYDHSDMLPAFDNMVANIWTILDKLNFKYRKLYFQTPAPGNFILDLSVDNLGVPATDICQSDGGARVFIISAVIGEGHDRSAVVKWMDLAIIATRQKLEENLLSRATGAYRKRIDDFAPFALTAPPWTLLYRVEVEDHAIDLSAGPLIIRNDDGPGAPDQIILYLATGPGGPAP